MQVNGWTPQTWKVIFLHWGYGLIGVPLYLLCGRLNENQGNIFTKGGREDVLKLEGLVEREVATRMGKIPSSVLIRESQFFLACVNMLVC